jgi:hypothetical protein
MQLLSTDHMRNGLRQQIAQYTFFALIFQIPFELRYTLLGLTNLQWTFVALVAVSVPDLLAHAKEMTRNRLLQALAVFVCIQWLAAFYAPEFHMNAFKAAARFTAGFLLVALATNWDELNRRRLFNGWVAAAFAAALYALAAHVGLGFPGLFRTEEFYIGQIRRLSGSFEYSNTAAAYFAVSLPIVWWSSFRRTLRILFAFCLWCAIVMTYSKGAVLAVPIAVAAKRKAAIPLLIIGIAAFAALLPFNPYLIARIYGPARKNPIAVEYKTSWNKLQQHPNASDVLHLQIRNTGITTFRSKGWWRTSIGYRWWDPDTEEFITAEPVVTSFPKDLHRGEGIEVDAHFRTPAQPGNYLLVFELFSGNFDWFSRIGVVPALVEADIRSDASRAVDQIDLSAMYNRGRNPAILTASVPRSSLWIAALKIIRRYPFGIGPDNYRLEYGKYLGASRWDTHVYSNNLYLEVLTGSGLLGLAAFAFAMAVRRWSTDAPSIATAVFLVHGIVDFFLMSTPLYFAFWILMGSSSQTGRRLEPAPIPDSSRIDAMR